MNGVLACLGGVFCLVALGAHASESKVAEDQWPAALMCEFSVSGQTHVKRFPSVGNPYDANVERIGDHFAFRAVPMSRNGRDLEYVSLYTYYPARQKLILLHTVQYKPAPHFQTNQVHTGVTKVYSPVYERELIYSCQAEAS